MIMLGVRVSSRNFLVPPKGLVGKRRKKILGRADHPLPLSSFCGREKIKQYGKEMQGVRKEFQEYLDRRKKDNGCY